MRLLVIYLFYVLMSVSAAAQTFRRDADGCGDFLSIKDEVYTLRHWDLSGLQNQSTGGAKIDLEGIYFSRMTTGLPKDAVEDRYLIFASFNGKRYLLLPGERNRFEEAQKIEDSFQREVELDSFFHEYSPQVKI